MGFVFDLEASVRFSDAFGVGGRGEKEFSDKGVVGDVPPPPQPKKEPSFDPLGDLGCDFWMVELESLDSLVNVREIPLGELRLCGGVGLEENMDIVDCDWLVILESLYHVPFDSVDDVRAESTVNLACFARRLSGFVGWVGTIRFGLCGGYVCSTLLYEEDRAVGSFAVKATGLFGPLLSSISNEL
jgi:hypothetical protein